jgi:hypothetical protein
MANQYDYIDAGFRVFGLLGSVDHDGSELPDKQKYKKPWASNWQYTPEWSDDQLEVMEECGQFDNGFGVLCDGWIIIDIDPRNGGTLDSVRNWYNQSGYAVKTGGGGWHIYFKSPGGAFLQSLLQYPGIDFKTSGYVVGSGSLHASGSYYEDDKGAPDKITDAPQDLVDALRKPEHYRTEYDGQPIDITEADLKDMLTYYKNTDVDYEEWIRTGMAIHDATGGTGFDIWDDWSRSSKKYDPAEMQRKWHSFGKSSSLVTVATIIHHAKQYGWTPSYDNVTFESDFTEEDDAPPSVDLLRPPGFVGELAKWIASQCFFPREHLAVAAALNVVSSIAGMRYCDSTGITPNLFALCVAGSGTGKEAIQQAYAECLRAAGMSAALHGHIKSEQEIIRNFVRHQAAFYCIDEFGMFLKTLVNSGGKSGAAYLEGVVKILLSAFTKANGYLQVSGDLKDAMRTDLKNEMSVCYKKIDNNEDPQGKYEARVQTLQCALKEIDNGIKNPYVNLLGFTTPVTFNGLVSFDMATNGFIGRSLIFNEHETNPKPNKKRGKRGLPLALSMKLAALRGNGDSEELDRVEHIGEQSCISDTEEAKNILADAAETFWQLAEDAKEFGLEAIHRRGYELTAKISLILAIPEGVRTAEHVLWAYEMVKRDCAAKMRLARSNDVEKESPAESVAVKIQQFLSASESGELEGVIVNRCRPHKKEFIAQILQKLIDAGRVEIIETKHPTNGKISKKYVGAK